MNIISIARIKNCVLVVFLFIYEVDNRVVLMLYDLDGDIHNYLFSVVLCQKCSIIIA